jgi:tetratricopeptide (TPR) repeat protein
VTRKQNDKFGLDAFGFSLVDQTDGLYKLLPSGPLRAVVPGSSWRIDELSIKYRNPDWAIESISLSLSIEALRNLFKATLEKVYGPKTEVIFQKSPMGHLQVIVEFWRTKSNPTASIELNKPFKPQDLPCGLGGFKINFVTDFKAINIQVFDRFSIGFVPKDFHIACHDFIASSMLFNAKNREYQRLFEQRFPFLPFVFDMLKSTGKVTEEFCSLYSGQSTLPLFLQNTDDEWQLKAGIRSEVPARPSSPVLEVLEEREMETAYGNIDRAIFEQKFGLAVNLLKEQMKRSSNSLYLSRRWLFLSLVDESIDITEQLPAALAIEPDNKLFLSLALSLAIRNENSKDALKHLSRLGANLFKDIAPESVGTVGQVIPEMLGDHWFYVNFEKSEASYLKVLESQRSNPRIVCKLAILARNYNDSEKEILYLEQLMELERRTVEAKDALFRLANIYGDRDGEKAVSLALKALALAPGSVEICLFIADQLIRANQPREAIQILSESLAARPDDESQYRATIEFAIGKIWKLGLGRPDLAKERFAKAVNIAKGHKEVLKKLTKELGMIDELEVRGLSLVYLLEAALIEDDFDAARDCHEQIGDTFGAIPNVAAIYDLLCDRVDAHVELIDKLASWRTTSVGWSWSEIYKRLAKKIKGGESRADVEAALAKFCMDKLKDRAAVAKHYALAFQLGYTGADCRDFLKEFYRDKKDGKDLVKVLESQLSQVDGGDNKELLLEILDLSEFVENYKVDQYSLLLLGTHKDDRFVKKQLEHYLKEHNLGALYSLGQKIVLGQTDLEQCQDWLLHIFGMIKTSESPERPEYLKKIADEMFGKFADKVKVLEEVLQVVIDFLDGASIERYLTVFLDQGRLPRLQPDRVLQKLGSGRKQCQIRYLETILAQGAAKGKEEKYTRELLHLYQSGSDKFHKLLRRLSESYLLTNDEIKILIDWASGTQGWSEVASILENQVALAPKPSQKILLFEQVRGIYEDQLHDPSKVLESWQALVQSCEVETEQYYAMLDYAHKHGSSAEVKKTLLLGISHLPCWHNFSKFEPLLRKFILALKDAEDVGRIVLARMVSLEQDLGLDITVKYIRSLHEYDIVTKESCWLCFKYESSLRNVKSQVDTWIRLLNFYDQEKDISGLIDATQRILAPFGGESALGSIIQRVIQEIVVSRYSVETVSELKLVLASYLFQDNQQSARALGLYEEYHEILPLDARTWIPLYVLYNKFHMKEKRYALLENFIMRKLDKLRDALAKYQVAESSIRKDYAILLEEIRPKEVAIPEVVNIATRTKAEETVVEALPVEKVLSKVSGEPEQTQVEAPAPKPALKIIKRKPPEPKAPEVDYTAWRQWISALSVGDVSSHDLIATKFPTELEKHLAIQAIALVKADPRFADAWKYQTWLNMKKAFYPLDNRSRIPDSKFHPLLKGPLCKLLVTVAPLLAKYYRKDFSFKHFVTVHRNKITHKEDLSTDHPLIAESSLAIYKDWLTGHIRFVDCRGMKKDICFDAMKSTIYLDADYYSLAPPSHLFHRIVFWLRSKELGFYPCLILNPDTQVLPFLVECWNVAKAKKTKKPSLGFGMTGSNSLMNNLLAGQDLTKIEGYFTEIKEIKRNDLIYLTQAMRNHIYRIDLAESLDLIGLAESIADRSIERHAQEIQSHPEIPGLLDLATKLKL